MIKKMKSVFSQITNAWKPSSQNIRTFQKLFEEIQDCKLKKKCPGREVRQYYFENETTAFNYPVIFLCETPSTRTGYGDGSKREKCWSVTDEDKHFRNMLKKIGYENALITNYVKCGAKVSCEPSDEDIKECLPFLL
jgi:hypothetical protein